MKHIAFITDLHVTGIDENAKNVDTRNNFQNILSAIKGVNPDLLIIGGDLCWKAPKMEIYEWIKPQLDQLKIPYEIIPGNHDDVIMMAKCFGMTDVQNNNTSEIYYVKQIGDHNLVFLDTSKGEMSEEQYGFLTYEIQNNNNPIIIMHHPPIIAGVPYMDNNHAFKEMEKFSNLVTNKNTGKLQIFCGHYHVDRTVIQNDRSIYITPSCYIQIAADVSDFKVDHYHIAYRNIWLSEREIITSVVYLE